MGVVFCCCLNIRDHPPGNSIDSNSQSGSCPSFHTVLNKWKDAFQKSEVDVISTTPPGPISIPTRTVTVSPQLATEVSNQSSQSLQPLTIQTVVQSSDHVVVLIPDKDEVVTLPKEQLSLQTGGTSSSARVSNSCSSVCSVKPLLSKIYGKWESFPSPDDEDVCPTCLEEYHPENPKIVTQCKHHYHLGCIYDWMERSDKCPICYKVMVFKEAGVA